MTDFVEDPNLPPSVDARQVESASQPPLVGARSAEPTNSLSYKYKHSGRCWSTPYWVRGWMKSSMTSYSSQTSAHFTVDHLTKDLIHIVWCDLLLFSGP